jgi:hypothetical protein
LHDVDSGSSRGRYDGGDNRGSKQHDGRSDERHSAGDLYIREIATRKTYERVTARGARNYARDRHEGAFTDDAGEEMARLAADCQANTELSDASAYGKGKNAGNADHRNE